MTTNAASADLVTRLRRRERWLLALAAVRTELLSGGTVEEAMTLIAERCSELSDADGALFLLVDERGRLRVWTAVGALAAVPAGPGLGPVVEGDDPWAVAVRAAALDLAIGTRDVSEFPAPQQAELAACWAATGPVLVAPIAARVGAGGVAICLRRAGREPFDADAGPELVGLAEQASIALEVADRTEQRRALELLSDRQRIARDLHDHVIQRLFAVGLSLQGQVARIGDDAVRDRLDYAVAQIDEAIADLRSTVFDLRSAGGEGRKNLRRRLADIAAAAGHASDGAPRVSIRVNGPVDTVVGPQLADDAEAVVREAISNAVKYASARSVVAVVTADDALEIVVTDDGSGIAPGAARSGLRNLAQRALSHGGTFEIGRIETDGDSGTRLRWSAPLP